jgi:hypothetical protein
MAIVIDGAKRAVRFQSRLPSSSVHILLDRGIGVPALIVAQIFWQTIHDGERLIQENRRGSALFWAAGCQKHDDFSLSRTHGSS